MSPREVHSCNVSLGQDNRSYRCRGKCYAIRYVQRLSEDLLVMKFADSGARDCQSSDMSLERIDWVYSGPRA
jgi:hypothetical protein